MSKADADDIRELMEDVLDCIWSDGADREELWNILALALESEYTVGYEDGWVDGTDKTCPELGG